jgi:hypothetical protein
MIGPPTNPCRAELAAVIDEWIDRRIRLHDGRGAGANAVDVPDLYEPTAANKKAWMRADLMDLVDRAIGRMFMANTGTKR